MSGLSGDESHPGALHSRLSNYRKMDEEAKLMRSRVSARECRARKKKRYQKLESMAESKEKIVLQLREELEKLYHECKALDVAREGSSLNVANCFSPDVK